MDITNNGTLNINSATTLDLAVPGPIPRIINNINGILNIDVPNNGTAIINLVLRNSGSFNLKAGTADFAEDITQTAGSTNLLGGTLLARQRLDIQGGLLTGVGTIQAFDVRNSGTVAPGNATNPLGDLTIAMIPGVANSGNYLQTMQGIITFKLGGTMAGQFNRVIVQGQGTLAGTLGITVVAPYNPQANDQFDLMTFGSLTPNANRFNMTPGGWTTTYPNNTGVRIRKN